MKFLPLLQQTPLRVPYFKTWVTASGSGPTITDDALAATIAAEQNRKHRTLCNPTSRYQPDAPCCVASSP
jgi:hypothetical protein